MVIQPWHTDIVTKILKMQYVHTYCHIDCTENGKLIIRPSPHMKNNIICLTSSLKDCGKKQSGEERNRTHFQSIFMSGSGTEEVIHLPTTDLSLWCSQCYPGSQRLTASPLLSLQCYYSLCLVLLDLQLSVSC